MNGGNFTKLFASIITSTIWREADYVRCVWVTMLAICDRHGVVRASVPGLAAVSNVSIEHCLEALDKFLSPDPWSRTKTDDGRRIEVIEGGWRLLNYVAHRDGLGEDATGASMTPEAIRKRRQRDREEREREETEKRDSVTGRDGGVTSSASASASSEESVIQGEKKEPLNAESASDRVSSFVGRHAFGRWAGEVEGYLRASRKPTAVIAELELWIGGELNRKRTDPETLGEALNAYNAATPPGEFKTNHFAGFVRGVHRGRDRNENSRRNSTEDRALVEEKRAAEERERESADRARVVEFQRTHPARYLELADAAKAEVAKAGKMPAFQRDTLFNDKLVELVRREGTS